MTENGPFHRLNPTVVKGAAFASAGLIVLVAPLASEFVLRFVLAGTFLLVGASDLWGHRRAQNSAGGPSRVALAFTAGIGLLIDPGSTVRVVELVVAAYLAASGALALWHRLRQGDGAPGLGVDIWRGATQLATAVLILILPGTLFSLALVAVAATAVIVGLVMVAWGLRCGKEQAEVANRGFAVAIFWAWLSEQDLGRDRRTVIADTLYFEGPDRRAKITSYVVMLLLSVAIASLAVLQDSTAVIIGAMLVAPLMTPIMGCAAGLVAGWRSRVLASLGVVAASVVAAIGLAWILASWIPALVPLGANSQILSRSSPTLLDMAIALAAGAAGAYATVDDRVSSSLTGVAVAVALVPPLGVVGITLEAGQWLDAFGAFLLFATNLVSIILASMVIFILIGFTPVKKVLEGRKAIGDLTTMVALAALLIMVPLGLTGKDVLKESARIGQAERRVVAWLGPDSTLELLRVTTRKDHVDIVLSGSGEVPSVAVLEKTLERRFGSPVKVTVEYFPSMVITASDQESSIIEDGDHGAEAKGESP